VRHRPDNLRAEVLQNPDLVLSCIAVVAFAEKELVPRSVAHAQFEEDLGAAIRDAEKLDLKGQFLCQVVRVDIRYDLLLFLFLLDLINHGFLLAQHIKEKLRYDTELIKTSRPLLKVVNDLLGRQFNLLNVHLFTLVKVNKRLFRQGVLILSLKIGPHLSELSEGCLGNQHTPDYLIFLRKHEILLVTDDTSIDHRDFLSDYLL